MTFVELARFIHGRVICEPMQEMGWEHRLHRPAVLFDVVNLSPGVLFVTTVTIRMEFMKVLRLCGELVANVVFREN
jgi:hypothetical protein